MVVSVVNRKGGAGKSTTAIHLAAAFSDLGETALVDLDDEGSTSIEYASGGHLPFLTTDSVGWEREHARKHWDHVVVDGYARPNAQQIEALAKRSDMVVIPTPPDAVSLRVLARFLGDLDPNSGRFRVLVTMVPPFPSREGAKARADLRRGNVPTFETTVPRAAPFTRAARVKRLAWDMPRGNRLRFLFDDLAKEVIAHGST